MKRLFKGEAYCLTGFGIVTQKDAKIRMRFFVFLNPSFVFFVFSVFNFR
ncbi:MAG: hypothetical protein LBK06_04350 [Planctomycetaceae bacterium]|nr:hypothetical protein [Planctomycetaceae bacterium]